MKGKPWPVIRLEPLPPGVPGWWDPALAGAELPWDHRFLAAHGSGGEPILLGHSDGKDGALVLAEASGGGAHRWLVDVDGWLAWIRREEYRPVHRAPFYARLPFDYHRVPAVLRAVALRALLALRGDRCAPEDGALRPPMEMAVGYGLVEGLRRPGAAPVTALILTHDVDTAQGFEWARRIAACEEENGFRSSWNVVTSQYPIDHGTVEWLAERGHEIGIHGEAHDNRLPFRAEPDMRRRFESMLPFRDRYRVEGFRSPSWCRTPLLFDVLREHFAYDTSCLDVDRSCPSGRGGVGTGRPFFIRDGLVEIPATVPFEAPAFRGVPWERVPDWWEPKIRWLRASGGRVVVNTHPDSHFSGNEAALAAYGEFLSRLRAAGLRHVLPRVAAREFRGGDGV